ncbi:MAG TPA: hypothetical protein VNZ06_04875 [Steroidobacteraceae bacterium]|jgi:hypothetical protein|nr:hypothetical protein [Steroidobacteraceae bacterium]
MIRRRWSLALACVAVAASAIAQNGFASNILFIGNSFTFGYGSPVRFYRADSVTDLNNEGIGGVPALFKAFTTEAGLNYDVYLETHPGIGIDWHLQNKRDVLTQRGWDAVVMHGFSMLDRTKPGDPATLISSARQMAELLRSKNPAVELRLTETWPRADQTYDSKGAYFGKSIDVMAQDLHQGYAQAAAAIPGKKTLVASVGDAWMRAIRTGVADSNPYDGIDANKLDLWTFDGYHASTYGYYLEALVVFGTITGQDPRTLGGKECSGFELGLSPPQVEALEQVAYDQLVADGTVKAGNAAASASGPAARCAAASVLSH